MTEDNRNTFKDIRDKEHSGYSAPDYDAKQLSDIKESVDRITGYTEPGMHPFDMPGFSGYLQAFFGFSIGLIAAIALFQTTFSGWFWKLILVGLAGYAGWYIFPYLLVFGGIFLIYKLIEYLGGW